VRDPARPTRPRRSVERPWNGPFRGLSPYPGGGKGSKPERAPEQLTVDFYNGRGLAMLEETTTSRKPPVVETGLVQRSVSYLHTHIVGRATSGQELHDVASPYSYRVS
jgi:hypothetical protein